MSKSIPHSAIGVIIGLAIFGLGGCLHESSLDRRLYDKLPDKPAAGPLAAPAPDYAPPEPPLPLRDPSAGVSPDPGSKNAPAPAPPKTDPPQPQAKPSAN